jgi:hypothetical protein
MTNPSPDTFDASWHRYAEAHARCQTLSGATLGSAQDQEREAISQLAKSRAINLDDLGKKLDALRDLLDLLGHDWSDHREHLLLDSIRRDVWAMARGAS